MRLLAKVKAEVKRMDPKLSEEDDAFSAAMVLLASFLIGPPPQAISEQLNLPKDQVQRYTNGFIKNKIWKRGKVYGDFGNPRTGGSEFWLAVACACGLMEHI